MQLHAPLLAAITLTLLPTLHAQVNVVTDDFEGGAFDSDWDAIAGALTAGTGAENTANFVALEPASGPLGSIFEGGSTGFVIDFFLRVQDSVDRLFNLQVATADREPAVGTATINLKYDTTDGWAAFSSGWNSLAGLPALTTGEWYRARVTGMDWGSATASFDVELSDAGGNTFTSTSAGNAFFQSGDPTTTAAASFNFNTNFGSNPGFHVDQVTVTSTPVAGDDPNLSLTPPNNPFAGLTIFPGFGPVVAEVVATNAAGVNTLTISDTSQISGGDSTEFSLLTTLPLEIPPGESAPLRIQFTNPGDTRDFVASLEVASNDSGDPLILLPLLASVTSIGENLLSNGDFEADDVTATGWDGADGATISEGIAPGSTNSASLSPISELSQSVNGKSLPDWHLDFYFNAPDSPERTLNVLVDSPTGNINLRFQGTSAGADQTWNAFDNAGPDDDWGAALELPAVQPGATYFMRIVGHGWGSSSTPTYDLLLSDPNSTMLAHTVTGLDRYQGANPPSGSPTLVRFSTAFGNNPGYTIDDVRFINPSAPPLTGLEIIGFEHDEDASTSTVRWSADPAKLYFIYASDDLRNWEPIGDQVATGAEESYTETDVTSARRFYSVSNEQP